MSEKYDRIEEKVRKEILILEKNETLINLSTRRMWRPYRSRADNGSRINV